MKNTNAQATWSGTTCPVSRTLGAVRITLDASLV